MRKEAQNRASLPNNFDSTLPDTQYAIKATKAFKENYLLDLKAHFLTGRTFGIVENGTWAPVAAKEIQKIFAEMKPNTIVEPIVTLKSAMKEEQLASVDQLVEALCQ